MKTDFRLQKTETSKQKINQTLKIKITGDKIKSCPTRYFKTKRKKRLKPEMYNVLN